MTSPLTPMPAIEKAIGAAVQNVSDKGLAASMDDKLLAGIAWNATVITSTLISQAEDRKTASEANAQVTHALMGKMTEAIERLGGRLGENHSAVNGNGGEHKTRMQVVKQHAPTASVATAAGIIIMTVLEKLLAR